MIGFGNGYMPEPGYFRHKGAKPVGADGKSNQNETDDWRDAEPGEDRNHDTRCAKNDERVRQHRGKGQFASHV